MVKCHPLPHWLVDWKHWAWKYEDEAWISVLHDWYLKFSSPSKVPQWTIQRSLQLAGKVPKSLGIDIINALPKVFDTLLLTDYICIPTSQHGYPQFRFVSLEIFCENRCIFRLSVEVHFQVPTSFPATLAIHRDGSGAKGYSDCDRLALEQNLQL